MRVYDVWVCVSRFEFPSNVHTLLWCSLPFFVDGDVRMGESVAMMYYVLKQYGAAKHLRLGLGTFLRRHCCKRHRQH